MVFVDFRKAFDIVDHQLLLMKLHQYRVSDPSLSWFESYLSGRQQFVSIDSQRSDSLLIKQGVPQGSVLGPALFLLFVNDIPLHLTDSTVDIYTDDTTITASAHFSDLCSMTQLLNSNLDVVQRWASCNKMFINKKKTKSLLVHGKHIPAKLDEDTPLRLDVEIDDFVVEQVSSHKILGVVMDSQINHKLHIDELCKKLSKRIGLLKHISPFLKQHQRETYYNDVIKPTLLYGSMIWDSCNVEHLQSILKLQKRAACIILDAERFTPSVVLFNNLNWLPFTKQYLIKRCALLYKRVHNYIMPGYLNNLLVQKEVVLSLLGL